LELENLLKELKLSQYISLDLETTGLDPYNCGITEVSAYRFINGEPVEEFTSLVNPEYPIPQNIVDLTGAGDLFAAGFLHGYINGFSFSKCLEKGNELSSKIIQKIGARLD